MYVLMSLCLEQQNGYTEDDINHKVYNLSSSSGIPAQIFIWFFMNSPLND